MLMCLTSKLAFCQIFCFHRGGLTSREGNKSNWQLRLSLVTARCELLMSHSIASKLPCHITRIEPTIQIDQKRLCRLRNPTMLNLCKIVLSIMKFMGRSIIALQIREESINVLERQACIASVSVNDPAFLESSPLVSGKYR